MAGKVGHLKIFGYDFTFVFRHKYEKENEDSLVNSFIWWNDYKLGFWFKKSILAGRINHIKKKIEIEHVNEYMVGINLLVCKAWCCVSKGALVLKIDK